MTKQNVSQSTEWLEYEITKFHTPDSPNYSPTEAGLVDKAVWDKYVQTKEVADFARQVAQQAEVELLQALERAKHTQVWVERLDTQPSRHTKDQFLLAHGWTQQDISTYMKDGHSLKMHEAVNLQLWLLGAQGVPRYTLRK